LGKNYLMVGIAPVRWIPFAAMFLLYGESRTIGGVIRVTEKSAIERIKELDAERARLFEQAKEEALLKATQAITDLMALGLDYQLINGATKPAKTGTEKVLGQGRTLSSLQISHNPTP
jgi:hypothetical protein